MTIRRPAVSGCLLAVAALAISACQVNITPSQPQEKVAVPSQTLPGKQSKPGKVVKLQPGQGTTPPGLMKGTKVTPPGQDGARNTFGQSKQNTPAADQKGRSKPGQAVPKGLANKPNRPTLPAPGQPEGANAGLTKSQTGGPGKSQAKGQAADAPWQGDRPRPQAMKTVPEPLPPAKGKPTALLNKPPKGDDVDDPDTADQAREVAPNAPGKAPDADKGKGKNRQPI